MESPIVIMGKGRIRNWNDMDCLAIQKAHYQIQQEMNQCFKPFFPRILLISEKTETGSGFAEGCAQFMALSASSETDLRGSVPHPP